ncbi:MAG TPA: TIGR04282 family arsenosugar biosynthesis glycosyltransferase [Burkholderiales bacterium]|nr:TIGR04282 family arsenosugar biosynthesis glycosyltransferase [Burkholderiales bacterium]
MPTRADCLVVVFARAPIAGAVKTRLARRIGAEAAARLHQRLVRAALRTARGCGAVELHAARRHAWFETLPVRVRQQRGGDLGERMFYAMRDGLRRHRRVLLIGSDAPSLTGADLARAARWLRGGADVVLAPAEDGGYALIGARRIVSGVFAGVAWGSDAVMAATRANLVRRNLRWRELRTVWDLDRPQDLERLRSLRFASAGRPGARR